MYSNEVILDLFYLHNESQMFIRTCRAFNEKYPNLPKMTPRKFRKIHSNFLETGSWKATPNRQKTVTGSETNIINVLGYFHAYPRASIRCAVEALGICQTSIQKILSDHAMHNYKATPVHLLQNDFLRRVHFCEFLLVKIQENPNFLREIIWTDESKFNRDGTVNTRNNHFWSTENPYLKRDRGFQEKFSINVFCLLKENKLSFTMYRENLNGAKYVELLNGTVDEFLDNLPLNQLATSWYQLDGAPPHCTQAVTRVLNNFFDDRWLRRLGPWDWPARSPDLTPLDFFLWGTLKALVYKTPIQNIEDLQERITTAIAEIRPEQILKAVLSVEKRVLKCLEVNGQQFEQFL